MRRARRGLEKRDANEPAIVATLRAVGASVDLLPGANGRPDLLVGFRGQTFLLETKSEQGRLENSQLEWLAAWRGAPPKLVRTPEQALRAIGALR